MTSGSTKDGGDGPLIGGCCDAVLPMSILVSSFAPLGSSWQMCTDPGSLYGYPLFFPSSMGCVGPTVTKEGSMQRSVATGMSWLQSCGGNEARDVPFIANYLNEGARLQQLGGYE